MNNIELWDLYQWNTRFKEYVDKYASNYHIKVEEALTHRIVRDYAMYCLESE